MITVGEGGNGWVAAECFWGFGDAWTGVDFCGADFPALTLSSEFVPFTGGLSDLGVGATGSLGGLIIFTGAFGGGGTGDGLRDTEVVR